MKYLLLLLLTYIAVSNALPAHPEKDNKEDTKLVEVTLLSVSESIAFPLRFNLHVLAVQQFVVFLRQCGYTELCSPNFI